jgi:hypothetical protein
MSQHIDTRAIVPPSAGMSSRTAESVSDNMGLNSTAIARFLLRRDHLEEEAHVHLVLP